jgi:hypothetical protein
MTKDNSTGKNKDFYELGKKMFDRLNPHIAHNPKVVGPEQEPVAWMYDWTTSDGEHIKNWTTSEAETLRDTEPTIITNVRPLYTTPQRTWVGLTDEEIETIYAECNVWDKFEYERMLEAKLKDKNNAT